jgi:hypothetical protein
LVSHIKAYVIHKESMALHERGIVTEHNFPEEGETTLDAYSIIYLIRHFIMSLNAKYYAL